jgi:hypothetical protein
MNFQWWHKYFLEIVLMACVPDNDEPPGWPKRYPSEKFRVKSGDLGGHVMGTPRQFTCHGFWLLGQRNAKRQTRKHVEIKKNHAKKIKLLNDFAIILHYPHLMGGGRERDKNRQTSRNFLNKANINICNLKSESILHVCFATCINKTGMVKLQVNTYWLTSRMFPHIPIPDICK